MEEEKKQGFWANLFKEPKDNIYALQRYKFSNILVIGFMALFIICMTAWAVFPISSEIDIECTTGYVGLDVEANNYIENHSVYAVEGDYYPGEEYKVFNETLLLDHINVNGIDNMRCRGIVKASGPAYLLWMGW